MKSLQTMLSIASLVCLLGLAACQSPRVLSLEEKGGGPIAWHYSYRGDPSLAGIEINQYSGNVSFGVSLEDYKPPAHPAEVTYYFWDGRIHTFYHAPNGVVLKQFWSKEKAAPKSSSWDFVDFGRGSDPTFKFHTDPRRKVVRWQNLHAGDPALAGIVIDEEPREGCVYENRSIWNHRHPSDVTYYFWDGRTRVTSFSPYGDVREDSWRGPEKKSCEEWKEVDFSYGSDPQFRTHKDPRIQ